MPSRMLDFDNLWTSDKLAACKESVRGEYTWLYGLADAHGTFEISLRAIHSRVSAIRPKLSAKKIYEILEEFHQHGMLFKWESNGKTYGFWTGSDRTGRLPKLSERHRYKRFGPDVPKERLAEYESRFRRDAVANGSRLGVGVGVGVGLDGKGYGKGTGEGVGTEGETEATSGRDISTAKPTLQLGKKQEPPRQNRCDYCDQGFANATDFLTHQCNAKTAGGYECPTCHSTFQEFRQLKSHRGQCSTVGSQMEGTVATPLRE